MGAAQFKFDFEIRPLLNLGEIEDIIRQHRIMRPVPCRWTLINYINVGTFEGFKENGQWVVYEDSFEGWVRSLQQRKIA